MGHSGAEIILAHERTGGGEPFQGATIRMTSIAKQNLFPNTSRTYFHLENDDNRCLKTHRKHSDEEHSRLQQSISAVKSSVEGNVASDVETATRNADSHLKLQDWYKGLLLDDRDYRSTSVFVEVKLRELDDAWPHRPSDGPGVLRTAVLIDLLARLLRSEPAIGAVGQRLLRELSRSIFHEQDRSESALDLDDSEANPAAAAAGGGGAGEPYFEVARRQRERIAALERRARFLEERCGLTPEARRARSLALLGRVVSRGLAAHLARWRAAARREEGWRMLRTRVERGWQASGAPRAFFRWVAFVERAKGERWQRAAEMAQWEAKYSRAAPPD